MKASSEDQTIERHITVEQTEKTAVDLLAAHLTFSKQQIKDAMQKGCVWLTRDQHTQRLRRAKKPLKKDDRLHIYYRRSILQQAPIASRLVADEGLYSVWDKSYGVLSHGSKWGDHQSLGRYAESQLSPQRNAFVVHRLDRAATGLMLIAHSKKAAQALGQLFEARQIDKHYQVAVHGQFPEATQRFTDSLDNKPALTIAKRFDYNVSGEISYLDVKIETGYKHQIRRHLSQHGYPVVGDRLYGKLSEACDHELKLTPNLQLRACQLEFISPFDGELKRYQVDGLTS